MVQMKSLESGKPPRGIRECMKTAGVVNGDVDHSGDFCKLGNCVLPHFKAHAARCMIGCHLKVSCNCNVDSASEAGCEPISSEGGFMELEEMQTAYHFKSFFNL